ncbi:uncharacterized protein LOC142635175 [Castanea sativa]|uniref:uncharacterized protein LOC142635175 n=1 Tax=Castanea sativa TaxID=21020 RepID=UPI003F6532AF
MRLLSWNCQGLGNLWTIRSLHKLVKEQVPDVCFLMETRLDRGGFEKHCGDVPFKNKLIVEKPNSGGGLALLWKEEANKDDVQVVSDTLLLYAEASSQCINLEKSSTYFSSNVSVEQKAWIIDKLKLVTGLMPKLSLEEWDLFWVICWQIWHPWNAVMHGGVFQHPSRSSQRALDYLREYTKAQDQLSMPAPTPTPTQQTLHPPQGTLFKLNFDGACFDDGAALGYRVVIRNEKGEVMATLAAKGSAVRDSEEVEVMACRKALKFAIDAGFMEIILEGDNTLVMKTVSQAQQNLLRLGLIYEDIWCLAAGFRSISTNCVRRNANSVAHALARSSRLINDDIVWMEEAPHALYLDSSLLN